MKKILIVNSQTIYKNNATGITLRSIVSTLQGYEVMEVHRYQTRNCIDGDLGIRCIQIPPQCMPLNYYVRMLSRADNFYDKDSSSLPTAVGESHMTRKKCFTANIKTFLESSIIVPRKAFLDEIDIFHPDVIYTMGASICIHKWVLFLSKRYKAPIIMHYMDNWRQTMFASDPKLNYSRRVLQAQLNQIEQRMKRGLTISAGMAEAYHQLYGKVYYPLMNTVDTTNLGEPSDDYLNIVYAGGLHLNRYQSLLEVADAIADMKGVRLLVYTSEANRKNYEHFFKTMNTRFMPAVPHDEITKVYENASILLHIESFEENIVEYTKYSLSTKIPEYMASGRPIICFAPKSIEAYKHIQRSGSGICIDNKNDLKTAIVELLKPEKRNEMGVKGRQFAKCYHGVDSLRQTVSRVISESI